MRPDTEQEQLHVGNILIELEKIEKILKEDAGLPETPRGLPKMKVACRAYLNIDRMLPMFYGGDLVKECCRYVASALDLARYFREVSDKRNLRKISKHLKLIDVGGFGVSATIANQLNKIGRIDELFNEHNIPDLPLAVRQDATRKSLELMLGLAALGRFGDVKMEDPDNSSKGTPNPDVIIPYDGENYGIACKSITTQSLQGVRDNIEKAISQLEEAVKAGSVTPGRGFVFLDVSSLLDHQALYLPKDPMTIWDKEYAKGVCQNAVGFAFSKALGVDKPTELIDLLGDLFKGKAVAPAVLVYGHTLMISDHASEGAPGYMKALFSFTLGDVAQAEAFLKELNLAIHTQPGPGK